MNELFLLIAAAIGGFSLSNVLSGAQEKVVEVVAPVVEQGGVTMSANLQPLYTVSVYLLMAMGGATVFAFLMWTFMQVFAEKKPGKEV